MAADLRVATDSATQCGFHMSILGKSLRRLVGGTPSSPPVSVPRQADPAGQNGKYQYALVACARWEETTIQEWVEYHKSIGFSHIYLYSNDDDPAALFRAVAPYVYGTDPFVTFLHWPRHGQQIEIYLHFLKTLKHETIWFGFLDIDEFFVLKGVDNIGRFMRDYETRTDCLYFNWVIYGNSDKIRREDAPTLTSYLRRSAEPDAHTKMLCRAACIDAAVVEQGHAEHRGAFHHFMDNYQLPSMRFCDVLHGSTAGYGAHFPESAMPFVTRDGFAKGVLDRAYIAHFQFRSEEDFLRRWRRGGFGQDEMWRQAFDSGAHKAILAPRNQVYDPYLAAWWHRHTANAMRVGVSRADNTPSRPNIALHKPSWQSSVFRPAAEEPMPSRTAGGGNNGVRTGLYGFHTAEEIRPWWIVDLLETYKIEAIHIYNRRDGLNLVARASQLDVLASADGINWNTLWTNPADKPFGLDGAPLVVRPPPYMDCRFILLRLRGAGYLHLDEVEAYGAVVDRPILLHPPDQGPVIPTE